MTSSRSTRVRSRRPGARKAWKSWRSRRYAARVFGEAPCSARREPRYSATASIRPAGYASARRIISARPPARQDSEERATLRTPEQRAREPEDQRAADDGVHEPRDVEPDRRARRRVRRPEIHPAPERGREGGDESPSRRGREGSAAERTEASPRVPEEQGEVEPGAERRRGREPGVAHRRQQHDRGDYVHR